MTAIDVVIPTFNSAAFVGEAVASALAQEGVAVRVFVVADGSTDGTLDALPRDARVASLRQPANAGPAAVRNRGIAAGLAPLVALLDADDVWLPGKLARQAAALAARPGAALSCTDFFDFDAAGTLRPSMLAHHRPASGRVLGRLIADPFVKTSTVVLRRAALPSSRPFDESLRRCEDRDLFYRLAARHEVLFDATVTTGVRRHAGQTTGDALALDAARARVYEKTLGWLRDGPARRAARRALARIHADLGHRTAPADLPTAARHYARSLSLGGGLSSLRGALAAPARRLLRRAA